VRRAGSRRPATCGTGLLCRRHWKWARTGHEPPTGARAGIPAGTWLV